jgi:hypothetical protein
MLTLMRILDVWNAIVSSAFYLLIFLGLLMLAWELIG